MSVSIKVAIRCRPFTIDGRLGVSLSQVEDEQGEVELINCDYSTKRFPFTYAWWSAYGFKRHCAEQDMETAGSMKLINQLDAYEGCGKKIKSDLLGGNAVVIFAYGLSGSGKTYTVFGPDAIDAPEAWFKWAEPHDLWGVFPRLSYELFLEKQDGWKMSMKYFQNVVDIVRDLMSASCEEQAYKNGMRKDKDGFMDIEWCLQSKITSWNDMRKQFTIANGRKAIAPTQFNPMSTRGHCILVLELEKPHPETEGLKQRGRLYVCDLAGTEPAGDIVYAVYKKETFSDGTFEYKFQGPHSDHSKTKELQEQGKKINLSLSEMAQFFMKMAEAVMKKTLKPGMSIPGCNSFFLCKYLKDTMLQARTYLFCAIRPETEYLKYTFATLGFAKNASVVKLAPKKASVAMSPAERKLMAELESMKALVEQLKSSAGSGSEDQAAMIAKLQEQLAAKQGDLADEVEGGTSAASERAEREKEEYARRGISLMQYDGETEDPYFINIDDDSFRSKRFMYIIKKEETWFGSKGDIQPQSMAVVKQHCKVRFDGTNLFITAVKGDVFHNGQIMPKDAEQQLAMHDRLGMGDQLMILCWKGHEEGAPDMMSDDDAVTEFQDGLVNSRNAGGGGDSAALSEERARIMAEREKWENEKADMESQRNEAEYQRAMTAVDNSILDLLPKVKEAKEIVDLLNRVTMSFEVVLEKGADHIPRVKISVQNSNPAYSLLIEPQAFLPKLSLLKDEMMKLRNALEGGREYNIPERHDPFYLFFDMDFLLGTATLWPEYLIFNLPTEDEELQQEIRNAAVPYNTVGLLSVRWVPLGGPEEADADAPPLDIEDEKELIGKPWTYRVEIEKASDLPVFCEQAYVEYDFFGETVTTEVVEQNTYSPVLSFKHIHHIPCVTEEFLQFLKGSMEMHIHITQHVNAPQDQIGTTNEIVAESIKTGVPKGYENSTAVKPKSAAEIKCEQLTTQLATANEENAQLKARIEELELKLESMEKGNVKGKLQSAIVTDSVVNGESEEPPAE